MTSAILFAIAAVGVGIYARLYATNMDVPPNAERFDPAAEDWRDTIAFQPVIYIQKG